MDILGRGRRVAAHVGRGRRARHDGPLRAHVAAGRVRPDGGAVVWVLQGISFSIRFMYMVRLWASIFVRQHTHYCGSWDTLRNVGGGVGGGNGMVRNDGVWWIVT